MIWEPQKLIREAIKKHGDHIAVLWSGGKSSTVALHMAIQEKPDIKVIFENTLVEFAETIKEIRLLTKLWNLNIYESRPTKGVTFYTIAKEHGLPKCRKNGGKGSNSPKCCKLLKELPGQELQKKLKVNAVITGIQKSESNSRTLLAMRYDNHKAPYMEAELNGELIKFCSQRWLTKSTATWNYHPLMHWTDDMIWKYFKEYDIPINEAYIKWDGIYDRTGCLPCTAYLEWEKKLSKSHHKLYLFLKTLDDPEQQRFYYEQQGKSQSYINFG